MDAKDFKYRVIVLPRCPRCGKLLDFEDSCDVRRIDLGVEVFIKCTGFECSFVGVIRPDKEEEE